MFKTRIKYEIYYQNISLFGLVFGLGLFFSYRYNQIPLILLTAIIIFPSIIVTTFFKNFYKKELNLFWAYLHNLTIGLIIAYFFVFSNDVFSFDRIKYKDFYINDFKLVRQTSRKRSHLIPRIKVKVNDMTHTFYFQESDIKKVLNSKKVTIGYKKGFWGYLIIKSVSPINKEWD